MEVLERKGGSGMRLIGDDKVRPVMGVAREGEGRGRETMWQLVETQVLAPITTPRLGTDDGGWERGWQFGQ